MLIRLQDLVFKPQDLHEQLPPGAIDFGQEMRQLGDMKVDVRAELVREHRGSREDVCDIRLVGELAGRVELNCARCLEPLGQDVTRSFDLLYRPLGVDRRKEEVSISLAETEIGYYEGDGLELEDALREQVLLAVPIKAVCHTECKGLCPRCGQNLNEGSCSCHEKQEVPRWHALGDLKHRMQ